MSSDVLADALWGDAQPARPDDQLAVLMSRLRSVLGRERIEHRDGGYLLRYDWLDAAELAHLLGRDRAPARRRQHHRRRRRSQGLALAAARPAPTLRLTPPGDWAERRRPRSAGSAPGPGWSRRRALLAAGDWMAACDAADSGSRA